MNEERKKTPINTMRDFDINTRLTAILQQAYHRRSRNQPSNLNDIVETLKGDLLKAFPDCPIETIDDAIVTETLHNPDTPLSPTFFFNAVKKAWFVPKTNRHQWDGNDEDLAYWQDLAARHPWDAHAAEMVMHYRHGDTEQDTISLLDTLAANVAREDERGKDDTMPLAGARSAATAFNARREFRYLILRGQLSEEAKARFIEDAILAVNTKRMASRHHRLTKDEANGDPFVQAEAMRLAVLDWLRACNAQGTTPSAILTPLANESTYQTYRRTSA